MSEAPGLVDAYKLAFRHHPAGVALITAASATGPVGLTASSVASVAIDPTVLSFSVTRATGSAGALLGTDGVVVHLLGEHQAEIAEVFARSGAPRFTTEQGWSRFETGEPWLPDAPAALRCRILERTPVGSSTLVLAEVVEVRLGPAATPLVYRDRTFFSLVGATPLP
ncbi:flavin reductase family protein [Agromyces sp. NPDC060279]|uniref:flavin reductase family protein n=1 Tax=Agromyces sp. NPDC060279 TaxID=3347092 RepID=UPI0036670A61